MKFIITIITALVLAVGIPVVASADQIRKNGCGWESSGSWAGAYCPTRWEWGGPQYFRIRVQCKQTGAPQFTIVKYGPWRTGGDWLASSTACTAPYSTRVVGQTWIEFWG